jgi:hypothetical protein
MTSLLIIADPPDPLAQRLSDHAMSSGWPTEWLTYADASRRLSLARTGSTTVVSPTIPMFLRLPLAASPWEDGENQFHRAEIHSLVWAAAALNDAPVVNRPDSFGFSSRYALSTSVIRQRSGFGPNGPEVFSSDPPNPLGPVDEWWVELQSDRSTFPWTPEDMGKGPYRAGRVRPGFRLLVVPVVGRDGIGDAIEGSKTELLMTSARICNSLGLAFATVSWRWYAEDGTTEFARLNPHPTLEEIGDAWGNVAAQLLMELSR